MAEYFWDHQEPLEAVGLREQGDLQNQVFLAQSHPSGLLLARVAGGTSLRRHL